MRFIEEGLSDDWVRAEVGAVHISFLLRLIEEHLSSHHDTAKLVQYRMAPSLIARSECELLSVSAPRFAVRASLPDGSFLNLRRLNFLFRTCAKVSVLGTKNLSVASALKQNHDWPGTAICDSVLVPPYHRYPKSKWHILTAKLGRRYGEVPDNDCADIEGTPFLRQMTLGGGMCAQSACFMANALMIDFAHALYGIAEITALANTKVRHGDETRVSIGGMNYSDIQSFLTSDFVDLGATILTPSLLSDRSKGSGKVVIKLELQLMAIRCYLLSGFPVILHFDYRAFSDTQAYAELRPLFQRFTSASHHAIVIVGCKLDRPYAFLVNDPSYLPFRRLDEIDLKRTMQFPGVSDFVVPFMPVTPVDVQIPLFPSMVIEGNDESKTFGVVDILDQLKLSNDPHMTQLLPMDRPAIFADDEIRLLNVTSGLDNWAETICRGDNIDEQVIDRLNDWTTSINGKCISWLWCIHRRNHESTQLAEWFLFLDAGIQLNLIDRRTAHQRLPVLAIIRKQRSNTWESWSLGHGALRPAAITSFCTKPSLVLSRQLPEPEDVPTIHAVEWYAFLQSDCQTRSVRDFATRYGIRFESALEFMACCGSPEFRTNIQHAINLMLKFVPPKYATIALATFVPLLSLPPDSEGAQEGIDALTFIGNFAAALRQHRRKYFPDFVDQRIVVEIVAGSRVIGIETGEYQDEYFASFTSEKDSMKFFLHNLSKVVTNCRDVQNSIIWAIELEPGPLFTIRDWNSLCQLCEAIEHAPDLRDCVGVNLDIAHWRMAPRPSTMSGLRHITPDDVRNSVVFRRIVHAHISGHDEKAHFGDVGLTDLNIDADFLPWLALLRRRAVLRDRSLLYSGFVSLEMEACKAGASARNSMTNLAIMTARSR